MDPRKSERSRPINGFSGAVGPEQEEFRYDNEVNGPGTAATSRSGEAGTGVGSETPVTDENRDAIASKLVERFALWSGVAGLFPCHCST